jgi:hypothetical protein
VAERFRIVFAQARVLPVAVAIGAIGVVFAQAGWVRIAFGAMAVSMTVVGLVLGRARPEVVLDDDGYAVQEFGREKLRVAWSDVVKVRSDEKEHALYVDCGDPARNLLVPPRRGYGFRFARQEELYARILARVPAEKIERVERLDPRRAPPPKSDSPP